MKTIALRRQNGHSGEISKSASQAGIGKFSPSEDHIEINQLLSVHVRTTSCLIDRTIQMEQEWLDFAKSASPQHLLGTLEIIHKLDRLRSRMMDQMIRVSELQKPKMTVNMREVAVVVAPDLRLSNEVE